MTESPFCTITELAAECERRGRRITTQHLRSFCRSGELAAFKVGGAWAIPAKEAERWMTGWLASSSRRGRPREGGGSK